MALSREQILASRPKMASLEVEGWGGTVFLRALSVGALGQFLEQKAELSGPRALTLLVALSACDEAGALLFGEPDAELLADQPIEVIQAVADEVMKLNKIGAGPEAKNP